MIRGELRQGEICNACVLLVKRWKKLPVGSTRHWHHVVDARAGPGTKSISKIKNRVKEEQKEDRKLKKHKHRYQPNKKVKAASAPGSATASPAPHRSSNSPYSMLDPASMDEDSFCDPWGPSLTPEYSDASEEEDEGMGTQVEAPPTLTTRSQQRKPAAPTRCSSFLDLSYWKKVEICCGTIFTGPNGELLLDANLWRPCGRCSKPVARVSPTRKDSESSIGVDLASDDSGLDMPLSQEMSNGGLLMAGGKSLPTPPDTQPSTPTSPPSNSLLYGASARDQYSNLLLDLSTKNTVASDASAFLAAHHSPVPRQQTHCIPV